MFVVVAALLIALLPLPYAHYQLLRIAVCAVCGYWAYQTWGKGWVPWVLGFIAAPYNPIVPVHLGRDLWTLVNPTTAAVMVAVLLNQPIKENV